MNIAHAAAVTAYEIFKIASRPVGFQARKMHPASGQAREDMFQHIETVLIRAGFLSAFQSFANDEGYQANTQQRRHG